MISENVLKYTLVTNTEERNSFAGLKIFRRIENPAERGGVKYQKAIVKR